jgi:thioester reductase-like protein
MARAGFDRVVLVTGFPSPYAERVVRELLAREPRCLVRAVVLSALSARAERARDELPAGQRERLVLLEGDVAAIDLGLSGAEVREVARETELVHHMAFTSFAGATRERAAAINVGGAREILDVSRACRGLSRLVFHSTALVSGDRAGEVRETELDVRARFRNPTLETRMHAEAIVRRAQAELPISIVRPSSVVAAAPSDHDASPEALVRIEGPHLLVLVSLVAPPEVRMALAGREGLSVQLVPLDYVARASYEIGVADEAVGRTFHVVDPDPPSARRLFEAVAERASLHPRLTPLLAKALLRADGIESFVRHPRTFLDEQLDRARYRDDATRSLLEPRGIRCPPLESYVGRMVDAVLEHVRDIAEGARNQAREEPRFTAEEHVDDPLA